MVVKCNIFGIIMRHVIMEQNKDRNGRLTNRKRHEGFILDE